MLVQTHDTHGTTKRHPRRLRRSELAGFVLLSALSFSIAAISFAATGQF